MSCHHFEPWQCYSMLFFGVEAMFEHTGTRAFWRRSVHKSGDVACIVSPAKNWESGH